jgi:hypothetical protein
MSSTSPGSADSRLSAPAGNPSLPADAEGCAKLSSALYRQGRVREAQSVRHHPVAFLDPGFHLGGQTGALNTSAFPESHCCKMRNRAFLNQYIDVSHL